MKNVLILGCARSGTSILGEYFEAFPGYHYLFEPQIKAGNYTAAFLPSGRPLAAKRPKIPPEENATFSPGLAFDWSKLSAAFPAPFVVIWIVRHPFDAVCSLRPGIASQWNHSPRPPGWQSLTLRPWEEQCAFHWTNINTTGYQNVRNLAHVLKYEEMVQDPPTTARWLADLIGWTGELPEPIHRWMDSVGNGKGAGSYEAKMQVRWSELNHTKRIGRHLENLTPKQRDNIRHIVETGARQFGYDIDDPR